MTLSNPLELKSALSRLQFSELFEVQDQLQHIRSMQPLPSDRGSSGLTMYSMYCDDPDQEQTTDDCSFVGHRMRASKLFYERKFFDQLYNQTLNLWETPTSIILQGNAGIGKSFFLIYLLRRLMNECPQKYPFVLLQFGSAFSLYHFETCKGWKVIGDDDDMKRLVNSIKRSLYVFEPDTGVSDRSPMATSCRTISFLSPRKRRIKDYEKINQDCLRYLYMPVWTQDELLSVAETESIDTATVEDNYNKFGGIIRHTLETKKQVLEKLELKLEARCKEVKASDLRSNTTGIDEDDDRTLLGKGSDLSGFVACYTDIEETGDSAFLSYSLGMTSAHANCKVLINLGLSSIQDAIRGLTKNIQLRQGGSGDYLGKDLELSVVHFLSLGYDNLPWQYVPVRVDSEKAPTNRKSKKASTTSKADNALTISKAKPLKLRPRVIMPSLSDSDKTHLCYPTSSTFGLVDCFTFQNKVCYAFQMTWQETHAFKLSTLWKFRKTAGIGTNGTLNLYFVSPFHAEMYKKRFKEAYLGKGESLTADILDRNGNVALTNEQVQEMWNNTHICVAFPQGDLWIEAIRK
jgi:hypothetical protein